MTLIDFALGPKLKKGEKPWQRLIPSRGGGRCKCTAAGDVLFADPQQSP